jgi:hypothetical protein
VTGGLPSHVLQLLGNVCLGGVGFSSQLQQLCDVRFDGNLDPELMCDAASFAIGFETREMKLGDPEDELPGYMCGISDGTSWTRSSYRDRLIMF